MRRAFRNTRLRPRKANASAKHVKHCMWVATPQFWVQSLEAWVGSYAAGPHVSLFVSYIPLSHRRPSHVSHPLRHYIARTHRSPDPLACATLRHSDELKVARGESKFIIHHSSFIITLSELSSPRKAAPILSYFL